MKRVPPVPPAPVRLSLTPGAILDSNERAETLPVEPADTSHPENCGQTHKVSPTLGSSCCWCHDLLPAASRLGKAEGGQTPKGAQGGGRSWTNSRRSQEHLPHSWGWQLCCRAHCTLTGLWKQGKPSPGGRTTRWVSLTQLNVSSGDASGLWCWQPSWWAGWLWGGHRRYVK